ncbi:AAA family ATPase [Intrasporangium sp. DVR]|uniref:AAA family ATPase n=1 Tax=Intrasporangium sp. DVR TaxID=3127867 RepID=UPI00313A5DD8
MLIAASVAASGWPVLALWPGTKRPTHRGSEADNHADHWLTSPAAVVAAADEHDDREPPEGARRGSPSFAVMTGQPSSALAGLALAGIDLDGNADALTALLVEAGPDAEQWAAETMRVQRVHDRAHLWGTVAGDECPPTGDLAPGLEWRGSTGYAALPGSRHRSGALYEVTGGRYEFTGGEHPPGSVYLGLTDPGDADPLGLVAWVHPLPVPESLLAVIRRRLGASAEVTTRGGTSTDEARAFLAARSTGPGPTTSPRPAPGPRERRPGAAYLRLLDALRNAGLVVRERGAARAVAQCPAHDDREPSLSLRAAVTQSGGATVLLKCHAGCTDGPDGTHDPRPVLDALRLRVSDLYDDDEPRDDESGDAVTLHTVGQVPDPDEPVDPHGARVSARLDSLRVQRDAMRLLKAEEAAADAATMPPFDAGTLAEVLARPPEPPHRVEGLILSDALTLVVAQRKTGKTTLALNLSRSLLIGEPFLGAFPVCPLAPGERVALLNYEVSAALVAEWADRIGIPADRFVLVNLRGRRNPLGHEGDREALAEYLRGQRVASVMADPFSRMFTGDNANDAGQVTRFLADLDSWARGPVGASDVVLTAHAGWEGERARNSSALEDAPDSIITLTTGARTGDPSGRYLRALGRGVDVDEDRLTFDPVTLRMSMSGRGSRTATGDALAVERLVPEVVAYVSAHHADAPGGLGVSQTALEEGLDGKAERVRKAARLAADRGLIARRKGARGAWLHFPTEADPGSHGSDGGDPPEPERAPRPTPSHPVRDAVSDPVPPSYRTGTGTTTPQTGDNARDGDGVGDATAVLDLRDWGRS